MNWPDKIKARKLTIQIFAPFIRYDIPSFFHHIPINIRVNEVAKVADIPSKTGMGFLNGLNKTTFILN